MTRSSRPLLAVIALLMACRGEAPIHVADEMRAGVDALHVRRDPPAAVEHFRRALAENPSHYGATFQLAAALEAAGRRDEAKPYWEKALKMAEEHGDVETAR